MRKIAKEVGCKTAERTWNDVIQGAALETLDRKRYANRAHERSIKYQI